MRKTSRKTSRKANSSRIHAKEILALPIDRFVEAVKEIPPASVKIEEATGDIKKSERKKSKVDSRLVDVLKNEASITVKSENGAIGIEKIKDVIEYEQPPEGLLEVIKPIIRALAFTVVSVGGMFALVYMATRILSAGHMILDWGDMVYKHGLAGAKNQLYMLIKDNFGEAPSPETLETNLGNLRPVNNLNLHNLNTVIKGVPKEAFGGIQNYIFGGSFINLIYTYAGVG